MRQFALARFPQIHRNHHNNKGPICFLNFEKQILMMFVCTCEFPGRSTMRSNESASGVISTISTAGREQPDFSAAQKASKVAPSVVVSPRKVLAK